MESKGGMKTYVRRRKGDSESNVIVHLNELCRLCLAKDEEMVPIYDEDAVPLPLRIMACVNLEVSPLHCQLWPRSPSARGSLVVFSLQKRPPARASAIRGGRELGI